MPRPKFTLFVSQDDRALAVSRRIWRQHGEARRDQPGDRAVQDGACETNEITVIDLTKIKPDDCTHHAKFAESPEIVRLIGSGSPAVRRSPTRNVGMGEHIVAATTGMAATMGTAAGLVLAAPVAMLDPNSRDRTTARA